MKEKTLIPVLFLLFATVVFGQNNSLEYQNVATASIENELSTKDNYTFNFDKFDVTNEKHNRDVPPWFVQRFKISAGYYLANNNTVISLGNNSGSIGTDVDFEDDLGLSKNSSTFLAGMEWRSSSKSKFTLNYYNLRREANYKLQKTIEFGDHTYDVDARVNASFNTTIVRFSYGYALLSKPDYELGLSIGTHIVGAKSGITLDNTNIGISTGDDFGFTAPLPDFGIWGGYAFTNRFAFNGEFNYFALKVNDVKGSILGYEAALTYKVVKSFDLSAGYTGLDFKVDTIKDHVKGNFEWGNSGIFIKAIYSFGKNNWN